MKIDENLERKNLEKIRSHMGLEPRTPKLLRVDQSLYPRALCMYTVCCLFVDYSHQRRIDFT